MMKRRTVMLHGLPMTVPDYRREPFVMGRSVAVCDSCDATVDTHERSFAGLPGRCGTVKVDTLACR